MSLLDPDIWENSEELTLADRTRLQNQLDRLKAICTAGTPQVQLIQKQSYG